MHKFDVASLQHCLHGILVGAMQAMEGAGRTVCDCTDAVPWECTMDMARQVWDKARHVDIFLRLLAHLEGSIGERLVQRPQAGLAGDGLAQLIELARQIGDPVIERALEVLLADDLTHVRMRSTWLRELPANAPERLRKVLERQQRIAE